ncbi:cytochrome c biogenesis factor [Leptolyngbyaceae cyanobacterium JSC-12]|nr:cytochrome c biogenesis factor [Leptolyngbyaceae cyanobacterium JSC-12]
MKSSTNHWMSATYLGLLLMSGPAIPLLTVSVAQAQAVPVLVQQGYALLNQGRVNEAIAVFQQGTRQFPRSVEAWLGLAIAYRRAGQDANAFQAYEQVLRLEPNNRLALSSIGLLGSYRPEWQMRGIEALTTLLRLNPGDVEARTQRALLYRYQGRFPEALTDYQILLQGNPAPAVLLGAAEAYSYNGNYPQALELYNRYLRTGGKITGYAAIAYARTLRNMGNPGGAVQLLESQLTNKADDLNTQIRVELAQAYVVIQQPAKAFATIEPLRGRADASLPLARAFNELGQKLNNAMLLAESARLYRQVLSQTPNPSLSLLREVADVLSGQATEREAALQLYRQLVQLQPSDRGIQLKRLALERQLGYISRSQLREGVRAIVQPLPSDSTQQQAIAQGLVRIEPEIEFLPVYQALLQNPTINEPFLNFRAAQMLLQRNDLAGARNALAAYTSTPQAVGDLAPQLLAAEIERREGNLDAAAQRYEAIIATNPANYDILVGAVQGLATIRATQGRTGESLSVLDQLIARYPQDVRLQMARAAIAYQAQVITQAQAEAVLNAWLGSRPPTDTPSELYSLVVALPASSQREPLYQLLAEADPNNIPVQVRLIQVIALRDRNEAKAQVIQLVGRSQMMGISAVDAYLLQGELTLAIQDLGLARASFESALALQPLNADALIGLGNVSFQERHFDKAKDFFNRALAIKPRDTGIQRSLIEVKVAQDYPLEAISQIEALQRQQAGGFLAPGLALRRQKIEEDFLKRRGFQPPWERY